MDIADVIDQGLAALLAPEGFTCACGRHHTAPVREVRIGPGALAQLPQMATGFGMHAPAVVADDNTWPAAGEAAFALLKDAGLAPGHLPLATDSPEPDEHWLGSLAMAWQPGWDGIVAVGSGTINDLCKQLANIAKVPFIIVATAPSMDGFASTSASMLQNGLKTSIPAPCPGGILADTAILARAPAHLLAAGLGDMLAKYVSLCEWRISNRVTGEYFCPQVARLVRSSLRACAAAAEGLAARNEGAVAKVTEGLVLSGLAMSLAGVTRPASGVEHYFSHVWDMAAARAGTRAELHGIQVGVGTVLALDVYDRVRTLRPDADRARAAAAGFDAVQWEASVRRVLGFTDPEVIEARRVWIQDEAPARAAAAVAHWDEILAIIDEELPPAEDVRRLLRAVGAPVTPQAIGITPGQAGETFAATKDIRQKYVVSTLLSDLGLLEEAEAHLVGALAGE